MDDQVNTGARARGYTWRRAARLAVGLSQEALAARVPCDQGTLSRAERGEIVPTPEFDNALLLALSGGPAVPYVESSDLTRPVKEFMPELIACDDALKVIARAAGRGEGDKRVLLALIEAVAVRMRLIERAVDIRLRARESS